MQIYYYYYYYYYYHHYYHCIRARMHAYMRARNGKRCCFSLNCRNGDELQSEAARPPLRIGEQ